jgi:peptidoglycan/xylan/chitin deacetylase (PgdA/CDA1 family)
MRVALTFDDGPSPANTPYVLAVLEKYNVPATFFVKGNNASSYRSLLEREAGTSNVTIGNHSWSHPDFHTLSAASQAKQLISTDNVLGSLQHPRYFRYPYGNSTCATNQLAHSRGYKIVGWHVDSCDWAFNKTGAVSAKDARICEVSRRNVHNFRGHVMEQLLQHHGGILLMHDIQPNTIHQLDQLIAELLHAGFTFGSLEERGFQASLR